MAAVETEALDTAALICGLHCVTRSASTHRESLRPWQVATRAAASTRAHTRTVRSEWGIPVPKCPGRVIMQPSEPESAESRLWSCVQDSPVTEL